MFGVHTAAKPLPSRGCSRSVKPARAAGHWGCRRVRQRVRTHALRSPLNVSQVSSRAVHHFTRIGNQPSGLCGGAGRGPGGPDGRRVARAGRGVRPSRRAGAARRVHVVCATGRARSARCVAVRVRPCFPPRRRLISRPVGFTHAGRKSLASTAGHDTHREQS